MAKTLYLASQSPRRLELLRQIGLQPTILTLRQGAARGGIDETPLPGEHAWDYVLRLANMKAQHGMQAMIGRRLPFMPIVAADTTVTLDGVIMGKPADRSEATAMLKALSGRAHSVLTGVAVAYNGVIRSAVSESEVEFGSLSERDIAAYVTSAEPYDKAGGYGIQGRAAMFIRRLDGSYSGVMGLPLYETTELLNALGFDIP